MNKFLPMSNISFVQISIQQDFYADRDYGEKCIPTILKCILFFQNCNCTRDLNQPLNGNKVKELKKIKQQHTPN